MARKGLPKSIIKKYGISKKAWRVFRGRNKRPRSRVSNPKKKRRTRRLVRRKKRRGGGKSLQTTVFKWLRIGALVAPAAVVAAQSMKLDQKLNEIFRLYTGVNVKHSMASNALQFDGSRLAMGWLPFLTATLTTYGIPKIAGIIRRI
jgi:hypothetical protein